jgi:NAD(P)-dependent dehydrogenase (short-subunit alcohol dehydrogenase family)
MQSRRILLTGVTRGLGRALLDSFVAAGHHVCGCGRNSDHIAQLQTQFPSPHHFSVVNVADDASVSQWAEIVLAQFGVPDLLINNAAVINANAPLWEISADEFDRLLSINVSGTANVIRAFVPAMVAQKRGVIVNLSSGWGRSTSPEVAPYCASKYAIEGLTKALAQELPAGMAAIPLNPGIIDTDMLRVCFAEGAASYPTPKRWAQAAAPFLLQLGPKDNGQSLSVPGA